MQRMCAEAGGRAGGAHVQRHLEALQEGLPGGEDAGAGAAAGVGAVRVEPLVERVALRVGGGREHKGPQGRGRRGALKENRDLLCQARKPLSTRTRTHPMCRTYICTPPPPLRPPLPA